MPFKRYQISRVWRADKPAKGRYREFYQCDIDVIGTENLLADAEIAKVIYCIFKKLGFEKFTIKINSRRLINSILETLGIEKDKQNSVIRVVDKLEKIGKDAVKGELSKFLPFELIDELLKVMTFEGTNKEKVEFVKKYDGEQVEGFLKICESFGIPEENLEFDISLARGLDYYTGIIYEVAIPGVDIGSVAGGGRYDDLCSTFTKQEISGVGVAFGFGRIVLAMEELGMLSDVQLNSDVLVTYFDESTLSESLDILGELQSVGVNTEVYFEPVGLGKQFKFADKKGIPFVVIVGPEEIENAEVTVKIMKTGKQKTIPRSQIALYLNGFEQ